MTNNTFMSNPVRIWLYLHNVLNFSLLRNADHSWMKSSFLTDFQIFIFDHLCSIFRYSPMVFTKLYNTERAPTHRKSGSRSCILRTHQPQSPSRQLPNSWAQHNPPCTSHLRGPSICPVAWAISSTLLTAYNQSHHARNPGTRAPRQANRWSRAIEPHIRILQQSFVLFFSQSVAGLAEGISRVAQSTQSS